MNSLVIVESGAKATKIKGYLDANFKNENWQVEACLGHIRDLPDEESAVNPENWTDLKWKETPKGKKTIKALRIVCKEIDTLYLATDPDREGEAIAWHLRSDFEDKKTSTGLKIRWFSNLWQLVGLVGLVSGWCGRGIY